jgi:hypothetical protein
MYDKVSFSGRNISWVNVSWPGSGNYSNTTYIPGEMVLYGQNLTVRWSGNLAVRRETRFQQYTKFYWTKTLDTNYYQATVNVTNRLNTTLREVTVSIEFANDTTADLHTVKCYDVTNGVYLTSGSQFLAAGTAIQFMLPSLSPWEIRAFRGEYYATVASPTPSDAIIIINGPPEMAEWTKDGVKKIFYKLSGTWINSNSKSFIGTIDLQFNFDTGGLTIVPQSIDVYDNTNNNLLDRSKFSYHGGGITITQDAVGAVSPGSSRSYSVYFLYDESDTPTVTKSSLETPLINLFGFDITAIHLIIFLGIALIIVSVLQFQKRRRTKNLDIDYKTYALIGVVILFLVMQYLVNIL